MYEARAPIAQSEGHLTAETGVTSSNPGAHTTFLVD